MGQDEQPDAGEAFGPYRLRALLGRGGMGEVWRAQHTVLEREVALKRISGAPSQDEELQRRFRREARLAARVTSAHVVPIHDFGEIEGRLFLDMRLVRGPDLRVVLDANPQGLAPDVVSDVVTQLADALDSAHELDLVHRDVKPSNVLVDQARGRWFCYLADFGVAVPAAGVDTRITTTGATIGTPAYMAPELLEEHGRPGVPSDVYALGCLLHEMLTGRPPFPGTNHAAVLFQHAHAEPPRPSATRPELAGFDAVVRTAMAKDPAQRFRTAGDLARALPAPGRAATPAPPVPPPSVPPPMPAPSVPPQAAPQPPPRQQLPPPFPAPQPGPPPGGVQVVPPPWIGGPPPTGGPGRPRRGGMRTGLAIVLTVVVLLGLGVGGYAGARALGAFEPETPEQPPIRIPTTVTAERLPFTTNTGYDVAVSRDGRYAYVVADDGTTTIAEFDTATRQVTRRIAVSNQAVAIKLSPDGRRAYVTVPGSPDEPASSIQVVDLDGGRVIATVDVGAQPQYAEVSPDGSRLYVSVAGAPETAPGSVVTIDTATNTVAGRVAVGIQPAQIAVAPDGLTLYVANLGPNDRTGTTVSVVDVPGRRVSRNITTRDDPYGLVLSPDGRTLYVGTNTSAPTSTLDVFDTTSFARTELSPPGLSYTARLAITADGSRLLIVNYGIDSRPGTAVPVLDVSGRLVGPPATLGGRPDAVTPTPDGHHAYVTTRSPGGLWLISFP